MAKGNADSKAQRGVTNGSTPPTTSSASAPPRRRSCCTHLSCFVLGVVVAVAAVIVFQQELLELLKVQAPESANAFCESTVKSLKAELASKTQEVNILKSSGSSTEKKLRACEDEKSSIAKESKNAADSKGSGQCEKQVAKIQQAYNSSLAALGQITRELTACESREVNASSECERQLQALNASFAKADPDEMRLATCESRGVNSSSHCESQLAKAEEASVQLAACEKKVANASKKELRAEKANAQCEDKLAKMQDVGVQLAACEKKVANAGDERTEKTRAQCEDKLAKAKEELSTSSSKAKALSKKLSACEDRVLEAKPSKESAAANEQVSKKLEACEERANRIAATVENEIEVKERSKCESQAARMQKALNLSQSKLKMMSEQLSDCEEAQTAAAAHVKAAAEKTSVPEASPAKLPPAAKSPNTQHKAAKSPAKVSSPAGKSVPSAAKSVHSARSTNAASQLESSGRVGEGMAWEIHDGTLVAKVGLLKLLPNDSIPVPASTRRIFLEIGSNSFATLSQFELERFQDAFLLSFEPLLHQYSSLVSQRVAPDTLLSLGQYHDRGMVLPFAVASTEGVANLYTAGTGDYCASLLQPDKGASFSDRCANPSHPIDVRHVPSVRLDTVLGKWLTGWPIDFLKLDARGLDLEVLRSAGDHLPRISRVQLSVLGDLCEPVYKGSQTCSQTVKAMKDLGYKVAYNRKCDDFGQYCYEDSWEFVRAGVKPLHAGLLPWGGECWHSGLDDQRDLCCDKLHQGRVRGCFNHDYTANRCCAHRWLPAARVEPNWV